MLRGLRDLAWPDTLERAPGWDGFDAGGPAGGIGLRPAGVDCRPAWWGPPQPLERGTELTASRCTTWEPPPPHRLDPGALPGGGGWGGVRLGSVPRRPPSGTCVPLAAGRSACRPHLTTSSTSLIVTKLHSWIYPFPCASVSTTDFLTRVGPFPSGLSDLGAARTLGEGRGRSPAAAPQGPPSAPPRGGVLGLQRFSHLHTFQEFWNFAQKEAVAVWGWQGSRTSLCRGAHGRGARPELAPLGEPGLGRTAGPGAPCGGVAWGGGTRSA